VGRQVLGYAADEVNYRSTVCSPLVSAQEEQEAWSQLPEVARLGGTQLGSGKSGKPTSIEQRRRVDRARQRGLGKVRQDGGIWLCAQPWDEVAVGGREIGAATCKLYVGTLAADRLSVLRVRVTVAVVSSEGNALALFSCPTSLLLQRWYRDWACWVTWRSAVIANGGGLTDDAQSTGASPTGNKGLM
jgi:hypothetical protein